MKKSDLFFNALRLPIDFLMLILAGIVTYLLRTELLSFLRPVYFELNLTIFQYLYLVFLVSFLFIGSYATSGLYSMKNRMGRTEELLKIIVASSAGIMIIIIFIFLRQELFNSRFLVLGGWLFGILFVFLGRVLIRKLQDLLISKYGIGIHRTILIGDSDVAVKILQEINSNPLSGQRVVKHLLNPETNVLEMKTANSGIDEVILADSNYPAQKLADLIDFCNNNHLVFKFVPSIYNTPMANFDIHSIKGFPLIEFKRTSLDGWGRVIKRVTDIIFSVTALTLLLPLFLIVAFAIKWETDGPVFARLRRTSRNKEFYMLKFRSMINNAHDLNPYLRSLFNDRPDAGPLWKMKNDPRITKAGHFLRMYRIDELPQLWNVLKGDISLVGPRPHQPDEIGQYQKHHKKLLAIKAGATGMAQVSGSSDLPFEQEVALDSYYIDNWSLWLDLKIVLKTIFKMINDRSAV